MKNNSIRIIVSCLFMILATEVYGSVAGYAFRELAERSDLIAEGTVENQMDIRSFDRDDLSSFRRESIFKVSRVYKGNVAEGSSITVFSDMNFVCDTSRKLAEGRRYLLMLKKHNSGFADVNHGRGMWEIATDESGKEIVVADSRLKTGGESYERFKNDIIWSLSEPPSWPKEPTISHEQAKKIALEALSKANVDLKEFVYKEQKPEPLKIGSDIVGIAYKGDPMWLFQWIQPEVQDVSPMPPGTFIFCYVHAHTGCIHSNLDKVPGENAAIIYKRAFELLPQLSPSEQELICCGKPRTVPLNAAVVAILAKSQPTLRMFLQAAKCQHCDWGLDEKGRMVLLLNFLSKARQTTDLAILQGRHYIQQGRPKLAIDMFMAALTLNRRLAKDGPLVSYLHQATTEVQLIETIADNLTKLNNPTLKIFIQRLESSPQGASLSSSILHEQDFIDESAKKNLFYPAAVKFQQDVAKIADLPPDDFVKKLGAINSFWKANLAPAYTLANQRQAIAQAKMAMLEAAIVIRLQGKEKFESIKDSYGDGAFAYKQLGTGFQLGSKLKVNKEPVTLTIGGGNRPADTP